MMFKTLTATLFTLLASTFVQAQTGGDEVVNWTNTPGFTALKVCARSCLTANIDVKWGNDDVIVHLGCPVLATTARCVCVADHLYIARQYLYKCAVNRCGVPADGEGLQTLVTNFCAARGFTAISSVQDTVTVTATNNGTLSIASVATTGGTGSTSGTIPIPTKSGSGNQLQLNGPLYGLVGGASAALLLVL